MELSGKSFHVRIQSDWIFNQLMIKLLTMVERLADILLLLPKRVLRMMRHLTQGLLFTQARKRKKWETEMGSQARHRIAVWWTSLAIYFLECIGVGEFYETITDFVKFNTRPLHRWEVELAKSVYGDTVNYRRVRIDELAVAGPKQKRFCYVSFHLVNSWGPMRNSTFIHELMHVWQYEKMGALYMVNALRAQNSIMGYNYGGLTALKEYLEKGKNLQDFNPEQQADIVADYYLIKNGYSPQWGCGSREDLAVYEKFIEDLGK